MDRRDFLKSSVVLGSLAGLGCQSGPFSKRTSAVSALMDPTASAFSDLAFSDLANTALQAAQDAGASYVDVRIMESCRQIISTREQRVEHVTDNVERGFGVRVIADGSWGFAASPDISRSNLVQVAKTAVTTAKITARLRAQPVRLAPVGAYRAVWQTPIRIDPFSVPIEDKIERLLQINAEALKQGAHFCVSFLDQVREHKFFASSEGSYIEQTLYRINPMLSATAIDSKRGRFETRNSLVSPKGIGYEYLEDYPWLEEARQAAREAQEKLRAPSVQPGVYDLILHPTNLWLTIHESVGHPTELDRVLGMEANYAGTSFLTPDKLGTFHFGSPLVNLVADTNRSEGMASCAFDDDGAPTTRWHLVKDGIFVDYQLTREAALWIGKNRSYGCAHAQSFRHVPFLRMPNVSLMPGTKKQTENDLVSSTDRGILIKGWGSFSIDHQRYNFQFGGQTFYLIKNGKLKGMLNDVAYQSRTPDFWRACDAICDRRSFLLGGTFYCGKGEPDQSRAVSHGCPTARFRRINIINTRRQV